MPKKKLPTQFCVCGSLSDVPIIVRISAPMVGMGFVVSVSIIMFMLFCVFRTLTPCRRRSLFLSG